MENVKTISYKNIELCNSIETSFLSLWLVGMVGMHVDAEGWIHVIGGATMTAIGGMSRIHQVYHPGELWCRPPPQ